MTLLLIICRADEHERSEYEKRGPDRMLQPHAREAGACGPDGTAEEVASLVLFLLSDESGYITGAEVAIDGGVSL